MKVRPRKIKKLGTNFYLAHDKRNGKEGTLDNPGGAENKFFLHEDPMNKIAKNTRKMLRYSGVISSNAKTSERPSRTNDHG